MREGGSELICNESYTFFFSPLAASALGLFEPETQSETTSFSPIIQNFNRFIFEQISSEIANSSPPKLSILKASSSDSSNDATASLSGGELSPLRKSSDNNPSDLHRGGSASSKHAGKKTKGVSAFTAVPNTASGIAPTLFQEGFGLHYKSINKCVCQYETSRETFPFVVDLSYAKKVFRE